MNQGPELASVERTKLTDDIGAKLDIRYQSQIVQSPV